MARTFFSHPLCCFLQACLLAGAALAGGPVYVNPDAAAAHSAPETAPLVTQTVYGFLDFTTTIGNTVMVFSPQSAPAVEEPKKPDPPPSVIETKPPPTASAAAAPPPDIKPSKPAAKPPSDKKEAPAGVASKKASAAESKAGVSSVVEVRGGPSAAPSAAPGPAASPAASVIASKVEVREGSTKVEVRPNAPAAPAFSSVVEVRSSGGDEPALQGNNVDDPEFDFLSRQPAQIVDETYKVINLKPSSKFPQKNRQSADLRPKANAVRPVPRPTPTTQGPRILKTAAPTHKQRPAPVLDPTPAGSLHEETVALPLEALFASQPALARASRRPAPAPAVNSRFNRNRHEEEAAEAATAPRKPPPPPPTAQPPRSSRQQQQTIRPSARKNGFPKQFGRTATPTPELATVSVYSSEPAAASRRFQGQNGNGRRFRPASTAAPAPTPAAPEPSRRYKTRTPSPSAPDAAAASTSLYKFKLSRPQGRWSYKTTPKPRVAIRRQDADQEASPSSPPPISPAPASAPAAAPPPPQQQQQYPDEADNEPAARLNGEQVPEESGPTGADDEDKPIPAETIKVEISTPADFSDVYFEIATIKSPYTFQVGTVKNTRYITVTSTTQKTLTIEPTSVATAAPGEEPLTENLLASTLAPHYERREPLDSSIATLPPIALAGDASTPPLETLTETFSTTQLLLKTHILPVIFAGTNTTRYTLVQSYHVTRLVTALKTLPPMEVYHFVPSKTLTDLNTRLEEAGSELHLELDFGEENDKEDDDRPAALRALAPDLDLANVGSDFDLADVDRSRLPELQQHLRLKKAQKPEGAPQNQLQTTPLPPTPAPALSPEQLQQLALLRLFNPAAAAALPQQVVTSSRPIVKLETVFETHVIPVINGQSTGLSTLTRPVATVSKTEYELVTSAVPLPLPPPNPLNPLFAQPQPQFAVTSSPLVTQTVVTQTNSKVLKLTFGAKTAYTTLYSTRVVPTVLTTYLTASVPVAPTAAPYPGYFPPAYPQFPFVG